MSMKLKTHKRDVTDAEWATVLRRRAGLSVIAAAKLAGTSVPLAVDMEKDRRDPTRLLAAMKKACFQGSK